MPNKEILEQLKNELPPIQEKFEKQPNEIKEDIAEVMKKTVRTASVKKEMTYVTQRTSFEAWLHKSYQDMDTEFNVFLKNFNISTYLNEKLKLKLKLRFFNTIMGMLLLLLLLPYVMLLLFSEWVTDMTLIVLSISSLAEIISAIIVLPEIIAKYLFNKDEEQNKINIITGMQSYNHNKRDNMPGDGK